MPTTIARRSEEGRGPEPLFVKTDGESLILRHVLIGGKRYDIRIWKWDKDGNTINIDENSEFFETSLLLIRETAQAIFSHIGNGDPSKTEVLYRKKPETCEAKHDVDGKLDLITPDFHEPIVTGARRIYNLLEPRFFAEWGRDPNASLTIKPTRIEKLETPAEESLPVSPQIDTGTSTESMAKPQSPIPLSSANVSAPTEEVENAIEESLNIQFNAIPYKGGVTYPQLANYAFNEPKPVNTQLEGVYGEFCEAIKKGDSADELEIYQWIKRLYREAYRIYLSHLEDSRDNLSNIRTFDEWCKFYAAYKVAGFIRTPLNFEPIMNKLIEENISLSH